jgi:antitoxin VapB
MAVAKVFTNGRSQAIRLPREFRVNTKEVYITREEDRLIIVPKQTVTWAEFFNTEPCPEFAIVRDIAPPQERDDFYWPSTCWIRIFPVIS